MYGISIVTAAATEPVTVAEAKAQIAIATANTDHDTMIGTLISAARDYCERYTHRQLVTATWLLTQDRLPTGKDVLLIPKAPLQSVTWLKYLDSSGVLQTIDSANYRVTTKRDPGFISLAYAQNWPTVYPVRDAVTCQFVAGYGNAASVPNSIKHAILLQVAHWFEHRRDQEEVELSDISFGVNALLDQYRVADDFLCYAPEH